MEKLLKRTHFAIYILFGVVLLTNACRNDDLRYNKKGYLIMQPGDTIMYRKPNIPEPIKVNNASVWIYNGCHEWDSVIITYNYD